MKRHKMVHQQTFIERLYMSTIYEKIKLQEKCYSQTKWTYFDSSYIITHF